MAVSQARRGFPGMNRSPRPTRRPTQKIWPTISITKRAKKNRKPKGPTSLQLGASQKAPKATNEKVASRLCALRNVIILAIFVPGRVQRLAHYRFPHKTAGGYRNFRTKWVHFPEWQEPSSELAHHVQERLPAPLAPLDDLVQPKSAFRRRDQDFPRPQAHGEPIAGL